MSGVDTFVALSLGATRMSIEGYGRDRLPSSVRGRSVARRKTSDMNVAVCGMLLQSCRFRGSAAALAPARNTADFINKIARLRSLFEQTRRGIPVAYRPSVVVLATVWANQCGRMQTYEVVPRVWSRLGSRHHSLAVVVCTSPSTIPRGVRVAHRRPPPRFHSIS